ncbi:MAG: hypothetical protein H7333_02660 [Bdellovibrionales bacterium]|nr:hypothetical protein [Oligoflexia bacterium]
MTTSKYWIIGSAISIAVLTACSSSSKVNDNGAVSTTPSSYSTTDTANDANNVNAGKNAMVKGAAPDVINPADDTVERRNANHYTSRWNRPATTAKVDAAPAQTITTTPSSADLGASSTGMGR